jgi:AraC-like DNA-binding protein
VKEIAYRCGFTDVAYFSRRFRQVEGCTPMSVREGMKAGVRL